MRQMYLEYYRRIIIQCTRIQILSVLIFNSFHQAIKRGLVSTPPSHMIGDDTTNYRVNAWIRSKNNGLFVKPRLFTPYAEEIKVCWFIGFIYS